MRILITARQILSSPLKHCTKHFARDGENNPVDPTSPTAERYCLEGAMQLAYHILKPSQQEIEEAWAALYGSLWDGSRSPAEFNDKHSYIEVLELFDLAIKNLQEFKYFKFAA